MRTPLLIQDYHRADDVFPREAYAHPLVVDITLKQDDTVGRLHRRIDACFARLGNLSNKLDTLEHLISTQLELGRHDSL